MRRLEIIDGFRGYFLVFMMLNHLTFVGGLWIVNINHNQFAFVEDAQGFIFLSGFLLGLITLRKMKKTTFIEGAKSVWVRAGDLYGYVVLVLALLLAAIALLPDAAQIWEPWIGDLRIGDPVRVGSAALMLFQATYMDILPQYIAYMLLAPFAVWLVLKGRWDVVVLACGLLWLAAQLGVHKPLTGALDAVLKGEGPIGLRNHFNLLGWQAVFFSAIVLGALTALDRIAWRRIFSPAHTAIPLACLAVCLFFFPFRVATGYHLMPEEVLRQFMPFEVRADFGLVYLVNFAAAATGIAWLVIAGPRHGSPTVRMLAELLRKLMMQPFLRLLGRHSLQVYAWHVVLVYAIFYIDQRTPDFSQPTKTVLAIGAILLLAVPPLWRERGGWNGPQAPTGRPAA